MTVLDRSELQASSLADLHLIADQIGLEGFRRLRKADLIDAILGEEKADGAAGGEVRGPCARPARALHSLTPRRLLGQGRADADTAEEPEKEGRAPRPPAVAVSRAVVPRGHKVGAGAASASRPRSPSA